MSNLGPISSSALPEAERKVDMDVVVAKVLSLVIITCATVLCGLLPCRLLQHFGRTMLRRKRSFDHVTSGARCFSGGVFLGVCFLHLIPETRSKVDTVLNHLSSRSKYPVAELLIIAGFFGVIFGEHVIRYLYFKWEDDTCCPSFDSDSYIFDHDYMAPRIRSDPELDGCDLIECKSLHSFSPRSRQNSHEEEDVPSQTTTNEECIKVPTININGLVPINQTITETESPKHTSVTEDTYTDKSVAQRTNSLQGSQIDNEHTQSDTELGRLHLQDLEVKAVVTEISKSEDQGQSSVKSVLLLAALSFHGVFEGLALGLQAKESDVWVMCVAIVIHRGILSFGMSLQYARNSEKPSTIVFSISVFSIICVVGVIIGIAISSGAQLYDDVDVSNVILQSLATGTIFYIIFLNILFKELDGNKDVKKISSTFVGFSFMAILLAVANS